MQGNIRYVYSLEIVIISRSLRSLVKIYSNLTSDTTRSQIRNKSPPYRIMNAKWIGFRLRYSYRASAANERRVKVCHNPTVWHIRTLKHSHQPEGPEVFIILPTDKWLQFRNSFTQIVLFPHSIVQCNVRNG